MKVYLDRRLPSTDRFRLEDPFWTHYLTNVRRVQSGQELEVVGGESVARCRITATDPLSVEVVSTRERRRPTHRLWLAQALTRKKKFEQSVRQGAELGVTTFLPVLSKHTVRRPNKPEKQRDRWRKIAVDATRIADRDWLPEIRLPIPFAEMFEAVPESLPLLWADRSGRSTHRVFERTKSAACLIVGPEGGFGEEEREQLSRRAAPVSLGDRNFRSETASIALCTLWLHHARQLGAANQDV